MVILLVIGINALLPIQKHIFISQVRSFTLYSCDCVVVWSSTRHSDVLSRHSWKQHRSERLKVKMQLVSCTAAKQSEDQWLSVTPIKESQGNINTRKTFFENNIEISTLKSKLYFKVQGYPWLHADVFSSNLLMDNTKQSSTFGTC